MSSIAERGAWITDALGDRRLRVGEYVVVEKLGLFFVSRANEPLRTICRRYTLAEALDQIAWYQS